MRDDFPIATKEVLAKRVGYRCSNPECSQPTSGPQEDPAKAVNIGVAAHITAASPDGPRYDPSLTPGERRAPENGIWLCQNHGKLVDNDPVRFTVAELRRWKAEAEAAARRNLEGRPAGDPEGDGVLRRPGATPQSPWDADWLEGQRRAANGGLASVAKSGLMEVRFAVSHPKPTWTQKALREAAESAEMQFSGWPFALILDKHPPKARTDGIVAEVPGGDGSYDYWALRTNGDFYLAATLYEDRPEPTDTIYVGRRICRVTEALLYAYRLYTALGVRPETLVHVGVGHGGLRGRVLRVQGSRWLIFGRYTAAEDIVQSEAAAPLAMLNADLLDHVKALSAPLFVVFDFFEVPDACYERLVQEVRARARMS